jgi:hypothetical protein
MFPEPELKVSGKMVTMPDMRLFFQQLSAVA